MKNFKTKLQALRQKAEQLKQVVESAPARAERLRGAVHSAAGQFQQLRSEVQGTVSALRMNDDTQLAAALVEIKDSEGVFLDAGYHLTGVDMEPGMAPRLLVHFDKLEQVSEAELLRLQKQHQSRPTLHALLSSMIKAEETAASVRLSDLIYSRLVVQVGPIPSVQIGWRRNEEEEPSPTVAQAATSSPPSTTAPPPLPGADPAATFFGQARPASVTVPTDQSIIAASPSFPAPLPPTPAPRPPTPTPLRVAPISLSTPRTRASREKSSSSESTGDWRKDALAKFKQMPDLGR